MWFYLFYLAIYADAFLPCLQMQAVFLLPMQTNTGIRFSFIVSILRAQEKPKQLSASA